MLSDSSARILVVDDEPGVLETIAAILEREGYAVSAVSDVARATAVLQQEAFAVVLTDLHMEDATGLTLVSHVRRHWPETTAVVLTGYASLQSAIDALREGAYDYLIKPCDVEELKATISRAAERSLLARALRQRIEELDLANAELSTLNAEMAGRVEEATRELSQKLAELAEAKQRLEEERKQREQFISMVTHELRQPLTSLNANAQLLGRPSTSEATRERARNTLMSQVQRLNRLIQDLSDVSHLTDNTFSLKMGRWDLAALILEQVELARSDPRGAGVEAEVPSGVVPVEGDRDRISQVLSNLLSNAMKYGGGGPVRASLRVVDKRAVLSVRDQGPGIPPDRLDAIFEPYVRLSSPEGADEASGLGLGLYIARRIVEVHGGRIWAEESENGAYFVVSLPLDPADAGGDDEPATSSGPGGSGTRVAPTMSR